MTKIVIIEDEKPAAQRLFKLIKQVEPDAELVMHLESVKDSVKWFAENNLPDLIFMDIELADGSSFNIFHEIKIKAPIIFTTAFNQYAIDAFKVNSIDYLLKPIKKKVLKIACRNSIHCNRKRQSRLCAIIKKSGYKRISKKNCGSICRCNKNG